MHAHGRQKRHSTSKRAVLFEIATKRRREFAAMADDLFPLDMHDGPVCEEEEEEGVPCEDEQVKSLSLVSYCYKAQSVLPNMISTRVRGGHLVRFVYTSLPLCVYVVVFM